MKRFLHVIHYFVLVDREELENLGSYDRSLIYASFVRQVLGGIFVWVVFLYAWSTVLLFWQACLLSTVMALIILFADQAIIGSEWSVRRDLVQHWLVNGLFSFLLRIMQLAPRIIYAVVIGWFVASLAELSLQKNRIDRVLREETRAVNVGYFKRTDALHDRQQKEIKQVNEQIQQVQAAINARVDPSVKHHRTKLSIDMEGAVMMAASQSSQITKWTNQRTSLLTHAAKLRGKVQQLDLEIAAKHRLMNAEINDPLRCKVPGAKICEGSRWSALKTEMIKLQAQLGSAKVRFATVELQVKATDENLEKARTATAAAERALAEASNKLGKLPFSNKTSDQLTAELSALKEKKVTMGLEQDSERMELEHSLITTGTKETAEYDLLDRRLGLTRLHDDPVYGEIARQFSTELRVVVIFFELSPVIIAVFFTPFSFYSLRMREKRSIAESQSSIESVRYEIDVAQAVADRRVEKFKIQLSTDVETKRAKREAELENASEQYSFDEDMAGHVIGSFAAKERMDIAQQNYREAKECGDVRSGDKETRHIRGELQKEELRGALLRKRWATEMLKRNTH